MPAAAAASGRRLALGHSRNGIDLQHERLALSDKMTSTPVNCPRRRENLVKPIVEISAVFFSSSVRAHMLARRLGLRKDTCW